jgi:hypothetical protein
MQQPVKPDTTRDVSLVSQPSGAPTNADTGLSVVAPSNGRPGLDFSLTNVGQSHFRGPAMICNWDIGTYEGFAREIQAQGEPDIRITDLRGEVIEWDAWCIMPATYTDDSTGEPIAGLRVVLFTTDGRTLATSSPVVARALDSVCRRYGTGPIVPPLRWGFESVDTRHGRRTFRIIPADRSPNPDAGA